MTEGYLALAASESDAPTERDPLEVARQSVRRSKEVIEDLDVLTRHAQSIETYHDVDVRLALDRATESVDADLDVHLERDATIRAADDRLTHLFVNAIRFAAYAEATALTVRVETDPGRLVMSDDRRYAGGAYDDSLFGTTRPNPPPRPDSNCRTCEASPGYTAGTSTSRQRTTTRSAIGSAAST